MKQVHPHTGIVHLEIESGEENANLADHLIGAEFSELQLTPTAENIEFWFRMGSIYVNGVRVRQNLSLRAGDHIRLHTRPKRYQWAHQGPLKDRLVIDHEDFLALDKPSGLPVHATLDNAVENAKSLLEEELGRKLFSTHRLDIPTSGLLLLAKNPSAQKEINRLFAERRVEKIYRVVTAATNHVLEPGHYTHFINPRSQVPREISTEAHLDWWECHLKVLSRRLRNPDEWEYEVQLLTGKTHQIRAQFAAMGVPILNDLLYGGAPSPHGNDEFGLTCSQLSFVFRRQPYHLQVAFPLPPT